MVAEAAVGIYMSLYFIKSNTFKKEIKDKKKKLNSFSKKKENVFVFDF